MKLYQQLASLVQARLNCIDRKNAEWEQRHEERIVALVKYHMPSGSGFDAGSTLDMDESGPDRLIFKTSFHFMNEDGMYDGWGDYKIIVVPSLAFGFYLAVAGQNRDEIKEYITDCFSTSLNEDIIKTDLPLEAT